MVEDNNLDRLQEILSKRKHSKESIEDFESFFVRFSRDTLRQVIKKVNSQLEKSTGESLKIHYDDPTRFNNDQFFVQVVLSNADRSPYASDGIITFHNRASSPAIRFEGDPRTGQVKVSIISSNRDDYDVQSIMVRDLDYDKTFELVLNFLEKVYA